MAPDPKRLVSIGYDQIANEYLAHFGSSRVRARWLDELLARLPEGGGGRVLDLGCGAGVPVARRLAEAEHLVVGIDGSRRQIAMAQNRVPAAEFIHADMTRVDLPPSSFDAVVAFYSLTHVPRSEHEALLRRIAGWLRPGGVFIASLGTRLSDDWEDDWLGTRMFFSHYDAETNVELVRGAGLMVERAEEQEQDNEDGRFLWVVVRRRMGLLE